MIKDSTSWHHTPFGQRVMIDGHPYFVISTASHRKDRNVAARRALAALAGL